LATLLWGSHFEPQARQNLRHALFRLTQVLGHEALVRQGEEVGLAPGIMDCDAVHLEALARDGTHHALAKAADLYQGRFLADLAITEKGWAEWVSTEQQRFENLALDVMVRLGEHELASGDPEKALSAASRALAINNLREDAHRLTMRTLVATGRKAEALKYFDNLAALLKSELNVEPDDVTQRLAQEVRSFKPNKAGALPEESKPDAPIPDRPSVAVLPFVSVGSHADVEPFADGLTQDIITGLSRIKAFWVIAAGTMLTYKNTADVNVPAVARELGVRYVLEGSVRKGGNRLRITSQLIEAETGHHIWAERIDRGNEDLFEIQDEFTRSVVASVQTQLILAEGRRTKVKDTSRFEPARQLARSWQRLYDLTAEGLADSRMLAEKTIERDPSSGEAARMIATAIWHQIYMGYIPWNATSIAQVHAYAKRAVEYSPSDEHAYWSSAFAHLFMMEHDQAVVSLRRSLQINPNFSLGFGSLGTVLAWAGRSDESIANNEIALRINPRDPSIFFRHFGLALAYYLARRYAEGLSHAREVMQLRPEWWLGRLICAACLAKTNKRAEAKRTIAELAKERPDLAIQTLHMLPFADVADQKHFFEGLRRAGLSETCG
jgi:TolB-like protein